MIETGICIFIKITLDLQSTLEIMTKNMFQS